MTMTLEKIEAIVADLPKNKLKEFRAWYEKFDSDIWDDQIVKDVKNGKLDVIAEMSISDYKAGKTKKL